jgi:mannan endo-1,4-beta-mannosidase
MKRMEKALAVALAMVLTLTGCAGGKTVAGAGGKQKKTDKKPISLVEAEEGVFVGNVNAKDGSDAFSGNGYVTGFKNDGDSCEVTVKTEKDGFYDLTFTVRSGGGHKENFVFVDGVQQGNILCESGELEEAVLQRVFLSAGEHGIKVSKNWGWIDWDKLTVYESDPLPKDLYKVSPKLSNPGASDNAKRLMSYLCDIYGNYILSGQYGEGGFGSWEGFKLKEKNGGKAPAVIGLEMGHCNRTALENDFTHPSVENAKDVWEKGGIVTMCYHWLAPEKYITGIWWKGFYKEAVDIPLDKIMNGEDEEGMKLLLDDIRILAEQLKILKDEGIPVLWRPLHEAAGGWFWWGAYGPEAYKKLYILMYEQLTEVYGLDNLIWVWNGQDKDWYPGDEYVDMVGTDIYPGEHEYASHIAKYLELYEWVGPGKMIVLSENGTMPDIDAAVRDGAMWGFFCTWEGEFVINKGIKTVYSDKYTEAEVMSKIYNHEKVLTLDELPDLKTYRIRSK